MLTNTSRHYQQPQPIPPRPQPFDGVKKPLRITGMWGIGDNLHQRAALRVLVKKWDIWLETCHAWLYHDFMAEDGLKLIPRPTKLWMHRQNLDRERFLFTNVGPPQGSPHWKIWYLKPAIDKYGSILGAMNASFFLPELQKSDFSLPVKPQWRDAARKLIEQWDTKGKPILIYRPIVLRKEWNSANRNPNEHCYHFLYSEIRQRFFVVSIASLKPGVEWIVGKEQEADIKLHNGMQIETMCGLFAEASMVYCNAGFAPVMAQAVGTPSIVIYGGRESFRTSNAAGAHLAPTLGIDPDKPCDCHNNHNCGDRFISLPPARDRILQFVKNAGY